MLLTTCTDTEQIRRNQPPTTQSWLADRNRWIVTSWCGVANCCDKEETFLNFFTAAKAADAQHHAYGFNVKIDLHRDGDTVGVTVWASDW